MANSERISVVLLDIGGIVLEIDWRRTIRAFGLEGTAHETRLSKTLGNWSIYDSYERGYLNTSAFVAAFHDTIQRKMDEEIFLKGWNALIVSP